MPAVVVKEFSVEETPETLVVSVPFPPAYCNAKNSDVLCTDLYLRISCPPYFFELDLAHPVLPDDRNSLATVGGGFVKCNLQKQQTGIWETVKYTGAASPAELRKRRQDSQDRYREYIEKNRLEKQRLKSDHDRYLVQKQIEVERAERERVKALQDKEKKEAESQLYEWVSETRDNTLHILSIDEDPHANDSDPEEEQQQQVTTKRVVLHQDSSAAASTDIPTTSTSSSSSSNNIFEDIDEIENNNNTQQDHEVSNTITDTSSSQYRLRLVAPAAESTSVQKDPLIVDDFDETEAELELDMQDIMDKVKRQIIKKHPEKRELPPPRAAAQNISITFSNRGLLPTKVARESEDAKWHARIQEAKVEAAKKTHQAKAIAGKGDDVNENDKNVLLLIEKAKTFVSQNNFAAAINAYDSALQVDPTNIDCFMNRSACNLRIGNHDACIRDSTDGLALISAEEAAIQESINSGESSSSLPDSFAVQRTARKVKLLVRRGTARVWSQTTGTMLAHFKEGVDDYRAALALDSDNEALRADLEKLEVRFEELCREFEGKLEVMNDYTKRAEIR